MYMHIVVHVVGMYVYIVSRMNTVHHQAFESYVNRMCVCVTVIQIFNSQVDYYIILYIPICIILYS